MKYTVIAFYPDLPLKRRILEYDNESEAYEYISGLRFCETPYVMFNDDGVIIDRENYDMSGLQMLEIIQVYC